MEIQKALEEAKGNRKRIVEEINSLAEQAEALNQKRQLLLQEALRLDGEVRALEKLVK
jgi:hypothetical protein